LVIASQLCWEGLLPPLSPLGQSCWDCHSKCFTFHWFQARQVRNTLARAKSRTEKHKCWKKRGLLISSCSSDPWSHHSYCPSWSLLLHGSSPSLSCLRAVFCYFQLKSLTGPALPVTRCGNMFISPTKVGFFSLLYRCDFGE
jgi:hypothetical protein